jgi:sortase A
MGLILRQTIVHWAQSVRVSEAAASNETGAMRRLFAFRRAVNWLGADRWVRLFVVVGLAGIIAFLGATVAVVRSSPGASTEAALDAPTLAGTGPMATPGTTTTAPPVVTSSSASQAAPAGALDPAFSGRVNLGGDKHPAVPARSIGTIEIPKIGLVHPIVEGIDETEIHWGPGHWPGTALPGRIGNTVFAGHRVTHTRPFYDIDKLTPGDEITLRTNDGVFIYKVTGHQIVTPDALWIVNQPPTATVTIFACNPKGSARQRYVVQGALVSSPAA